MIRREFIKKFVSLNPSLLFVRRSSQLDVEKLEKDSTEVQVVDEDAKFKEEEIQQKRNKSRLHDKHRDFLHEINPYPEPMSWHHGTIKYVRRAYGRYGQSSGVDPSICWPVKEELNDALAYEQIKYSYTIPEIVAQAKQKRKEKEESTRIRQNDIIKKMENLEMWKQDFYDRINKKEGEAKAARDRKERLIEEVKRHFGYTVDPRDDRFKEMLEKKEKEQKKAMKEARRIAKEEKMVQKLLKKKGEKQDKEKVE